MGGLNFGSFSKKRASLVLSNLEFHMKYFLAFILCIGVFSSDVFASSRNMEPAKPPPETGILMLPDSMRQDWKCLTHRVSEKEGVTEYIPVDQDTSDIRDLITVMFQDRSTWKLKFKNVAQFFQHMVISATASKDGLSFNILEQNEDDLIYEYIQQPQSGSPLEHDVARLFLTEKGLHRISYTHKKRMMSKEEKDNWIQILKQGSFVVSMDEANKPGSFSLMSRAFAALDLATALDGWKEQGKETLGEGQTFHFFIPNELVGKELINEWVELFTTTSALGRTFDELVLMEKEQIRSETDQEVTFQVLKKSATEEIYYFSQRHDQVCLNGIVRSCSDHRGYRNIAYRKISSRQMKPEEIAVWQKKFEAVEIS